MEEELNGVLVQLEGDGLQKSHKVSQHLLVPQVVAKPDNVIQMVVGEQKEHRRLLADVGDEDAERLHTGNVSLNITPH